MVCFSSDGISIDLLQCCLQSGNAENGDVLNNALGAVVGLVAFHVEGTDSSKQMRLYYIRFPFLQFRENAL